jgi:ferritin-like metal-binding protein YciE
LREAEGGPVANDNAMTLKDLLVEQLRDLYDGEKQLAKALPQLAGAAVGDGLRIALESHLEETRNHVARLEDIFVLLGIPPAAKQCEGIAGIVREGARIVGSSKLDGALKDAALIAQAQKAEHHEMAGYGTAAAWANTLGLTQVAASLEQTLEEERAADQALSDLALQEVNISAQHEEAP